MNRIILSFCVLLVFCVSGFAQSQINNFPLEQDKIDQIIKSFTTKEIEYFNVLSTKFGFQRDAIMQTIGIGGQVSGEYRRKSVFIFNNEGDRGEKVLFAPLSTLKDIVITAQDLEDLSGGGVNSFALDPKNIPLYSFTYIGKEKIDELSLLVFDVAPKVTPSPKANIRLFQGRIWVDDAELAIVKTKGKGVPEAKNNKFPIVETWRENIAGKYWFPSYSYANDELVFDSGDVVKLKLKITYTDYKETKATVKVLDDEEVVEDPKKPAPTATPTPTPKKP